MSAERILFCHCAYAEVVPSEVKNEVLRRLGDSGCAFHAVPDLCEMAARKDPALARLAGPDGLKIAACYPRAVKWLFHAAGSPLPDSGVEILNMREATAAEVTRRLLPEASWSDGKNEVHVRDVSRSNAEEVVGVAREVRERTGARRPGAWKPWFPVIDHDRCTNCMQCLTFCLFDVYGVDAQKRITVQNASNCKTDCPACARVCPEVAILFPKYANGPINGDVVRSEDVGREAMKVDISALLGGDLYGSLRTRTQEARKRFSTERDESRALLERKRCLKKLGKELDIPDEVLMTLPTAEDIEERVERARAKLAKRRAESQTMKDTKSAPTEDDWGI